jgi:hypothetical protein
MYKYFINNCINELFRTIAFLFHTIAFFSWRCQGGFNLVGFRIDLLSEDHARSLIASSPSQFLLSSTVTLSTHVAHLISAPVFTCALSRPNAIKALLDIAGLISIDRSIQLYILLACQYAHLHRCIACIYANLHHGLYLIVMLFS